MISALAQMFSVELMQRSLAVALLVGITAPIVGSYLVQRGMALMGDGIGHVALTGVALGWLAASWVGVAPDDFAVSGAFVIAVVGALLIEWMRSAGRNSSDTALAILFYGGIALGVLLITLGGGTAANLNYYLFGSISTVSNLDVIYTVVLAVVVGVVGLGLRGPMFSVTNDEGFARSSGLAARHWNVLIAVLAALTVAVSMRVVGVLLVSAIMIVPNATAQLFTRSFTATQRWAMGIGAVTSLVGLTITWFVAISPGATIVVLLIAVYVLTATCLALVRRRSAPRASTARP